MSSAECTGVLCDRAIRMCRRLTGVCADERQSVHVYERRRHNTRPADESTARSRHRQTRSQRRRPVPPRPVDQVLYFCPKIIPKIQLTVTVDLISLCVCVRAISAVDNERFVKFGFHEDPVCVFFYLLATLSHFHFRCLLF